MKNFQYLAATATMLVSAFLTPSISKADVISKIVLSDSNAVSTDYVFQGSKNMKHRKSGRITSNIVVPSLSLDPIVSPSTVPQPALVNPPIKPKTKTKPRFGHGSNYSDDDVSKAPVEYRTQKVSETVAPSNPAPPVVEQAVQQGQVIQFRRNYGTTRYYPVIPHFHGYGNSYYGSPFNGYYSSGFGSGCGSYYGGYGYYSHRGLSSFSIRGRNFSFQLVR